MTDKELLEALKGNPVLKSKVESLVQLSSGSHNGVEVTWGDTAEELIIGEIEGLGRDVLEKWANSRASKAGNDFKKSLTELTKKTKKKGTLA